MLNDLGSWSDAVAEVIADDMDAGVICRAYTWLPGDFDPHALHRRRGWSLRRYRGEHRDRALTVTEIRDSIDARAGATRAAHRRSLRYQPSFRHPEMIDLGVATVNLKFYGVPPDPGAPLTMATLTFEPDAAMMTVPVQGGILEVEAADTGPILMTPQREHAERMARMALAYLHVKQQFDAGVTRGASATLRG